jgi:osmoprotectant transport system permease protein
VTPGDPIFDWSWARGHGALILLRLEGHLVLTGLALLFGLLISLPLGLLAYKARWTYGPITAVAGILYTIPSLALFAFLVTIFGLSVLTAEIALVSYTLLILIRNTVAALRGVPSEVREAAVGMGLSPTQVLFKVELPLALPVIVAGLRVATVTTIGLVTVSAVIGLNNLGDFIIDGIDRAFNTPAVLGALLSVALAVAADVLLLGCERLLIPWSRRSGRAA